MTPIWLLHIIIKFAIGAIGRSFTDVKDISAKKEAAEPRTRFPQQDERKGRQGRAAPQKAKRAEALVAVGAAVAVAGRRCRIAMPLHGAGAA